MFIRMIKTLPRLITIPGLNMEQYRSLQAGSTVEVSDDIGQYLIDKTFCCEMNNGIVSIKDGE